MCGLYIIIKAGKGNACEQSENMQRKVDTMTEAVILAGGKSRRMGQDKLALPQDGRTVLASAVSRFEKYFDAVYVSVNDIERYLHYHGRR
jgi:CTP:molybdopterin cytidylyltransferase MocA